MRIPPAPLFDERRIRRDSGHSCRDVPSQGQSPKKQASCDCIAGRQAALPQNCLTTEKESMTASLSRPRHFSNVTLISVPCFRFWRRNCRIRFY